MVEMVAKAGRQKIQTVSGHKKRASVCFNAKTRMDFT